MLSKGLEKILAPVFLPTFIFSILVFGMAEASRRVIDLDNSLKNNILTTRQAEISGKLFDICINHAEKSITVKGFVEDWDEYDKIKDHFKYRGPADYQVTCDLYFMY